MSGRAALITGGSSGIGLAIARMRVEGEVPKDEMIQPEDIAEAVRFLLATSPSCIVPEIQFVRPGDVQRHT